MITLRPRATLLPYTTLFRSFGRQRISVADLLNRWIVPLDRGIDFLRLPSGKTVQIPFNQMLVFSTNLQPCDLVRSEEHTSELQSQFHLVCRLLLVKKKTVNR